MTWNSLIATAMILHRRLLLSQEVLKILLPCDIIFIVFVVLIDFFTSESCVPDA